MTPALTTTSQSRSVWMSCWRACALNCAGQRHLPITETSQAVLDLGDFRIDSDARRVFVRGTEVHLTPKEYELLLHFVRHAGKVLTHRALLSAVWGGNYTEQGEYLRVRGTTAKEDRAEPLDSALHTHRTLDWLSLPTRRLIRKSAAGPIHE